MCRAVVLSPIKAPAALAAGLSLVGSGATVFATNKGSAVFLEVPATGGMDEELAALLGEDRPLPKEVADMASLVSKMDALGSVALASWTHPGDQGVTGNVTARRFVNGKDDGTMSSGLVLASLDDRVEAVLLGQADAEDAQAADSRGKWTGFLKGPGFRG